jgi:phage terminase Nu1 subunit (DNA packaging protein)
MLTSIEIEAHTGVSQRTIRKWTEEGVIPQTDEMGIVVKSIITYYKGQTAEARRDRTKEGQDELYAAKVRLTEAQAEKAELENLERHGELVNADSVVLAWSAYIAACKGLLLGLPTRLALDLAGINDPKKILILIQESVDEALIELSHERFVQRLDSPAISRPNL